MAASVNPARISWLTPSLLQPSKELNKSRDGLRLTTLILDCHSNQIATFAVDAKPPPNTFELRLQRISVHDTVARSTPPATAPLARPPLGHPEDERLRQYRIEATTDNGHPAFRTYRLPVLTLDAFDHHPRIFSFLWYWTAPTRQVIGIYAFCQLKRLLDRMIEIGLHGLAVHAPP